MFSKVRHSAFVLKMHQMCQTASFSAAAPSLERMTSGDTIFLKGMVFHGFHGVMAEENVLGQKFKVDVTMHCDLQEAGATDDLHKTVNYADVFRIAQSVTEGPPRKLIERVAEDIAQTTLSSQPRVHSVRVAVCKPHVSLPGVFDSVGVEIFRLRS